MVGAVDGVGVMGLGLMGLGEGNLSLRKMNIMTESVEYRLRIPVILLAVEQFEIKFLGNCSFEQFVVLIHWASYDLTRDHGLSSKRYSKWTFNGMVPCVAPEPSRWSGNGYHRAAEMGQSKMSLRAVPKQWTLQSHRRHTEKGARSYRKSFARQRIGAVEKVDQEPWWDNG